MSWLVIKRSNNGRPPVIVFSIVPRHDYPSQSSAQADCDILNKMFGPELTYTVEEWPSIKAAIASGYRLAK